MLFRFIIFALLTLDISFALAKEIVIISDLDETLRIANIEHKIKAGVKLLTGIKPYEGMRAIFQEIKSKNTDVKFYYLSNSYPFLYCGPNWLSKHGFPDGVVYQRDLKDKADTFKPTKLREIAQNHPQAEFILFGDNVERDPLFYRKFIAESNLLDVQVFIRDAKLSFTEEIGMTYFQSETQIIDDLNMSEDTSNKIRKLPFNKLVPTFLFKNLKKRLIQQCSDTRRLCKEKAEQRVLEVIDLIKELPGDEASYLL